MHWLQKVVHLYSDGFKTMTIGKTLWIIIAIKFFLIFVVLKLFFFQDTLKTQFSNDADRAHFVLQNLTNP